MHRTFVVATFMLLLRWSTRTGPARTDDGRGDERGDVPGWVLITVMTAGLVAGHWAIAGPALEGMLRQALTSVR